jgi:uncharacterized protein YjiS (DUF1127 family)
MAHLFQDLRTALRKRAEYNRTVSELRAMPQETAIDLGIFKSDAEKIAARAVYGR